MSSKNDKLVVYGQLIRLLMRARRHMFAASESRQLTPVQSMLLISLDPDSSVSMNELSEMMCCDASNITGLTERLESGGYIERITDPSDRRVKKIRLTKKGLECREAGLEFLKEADAMDVSKLSAEEVRSLQTITTKLT